MCSILCRHMPMITRTCTGTWKVSGGSPEDVQGFEGAVELCQLHQLHLLDLVVVTGNIDTTLDDGLDLHVHAHIHVHAGRRGRERGKGREGGGERGGRGERGEGREGGGEGRVGRDRRQESRMINATHTLQYMHTHNSFTSCDEKAQEYF